MKEIKLGKSGLVALVDDEDYERVNKLKWRIYGSRKNNTRYASTSIKTENGTYKSVSMHRFILGITDKKIQVDHRFHNGLDNRKSKIRICNNDQNNYNKIVKEKLLTKYKGVTWLSDTNYKAVLTFNKKKYYLGGFKTEVAAAQAYDKKALELFGEFACLNFPIQ